MNSYGLVFGGEKTSHDSGNDIAYNVVSGNDYTQVVIEGDEYILPKEAMQSDKVYDFVDKLPIEMLDEIKRSTNVFVQFPTLRQGDMVVCKNSVRNDDLHTISGTAKEISNYLQGLSACRMYAKGGYVEGGEVEDENEDSNIRFLTPMPPSKLNKTGIDSLAEIINKDEIRLAMSGALYAGKKRIVATDAHILVVLENQTYPDSLKGTIKSLWNKVPQERLVGVNYPNWEVVVPQTEQYQTAELSIDDVLAYAYGGVLQGKKIIAEKDYNKYGKQNFHYALRINIGNLEIFVDSLLLTRILRVLKANDVRRIVFHIGSSNQRPIKITTDKEHYGLIMPIMGGNEYTFLSQNIFYPISQKDFRRMTETYGNYLKEFAKMIKGDIPAMAEGGEISMNMPLLIRVLELAKEDVKDDNEIHFIAERLQSIAEKGTLTMEDYDYISGLEDNPKIQKMYSDMLERGGGGEVEDLISKGIVELKMFDTKPEHAKEYGLQCLNPLYVQTICVSESKRLKGLGTKVLSYIEKYAIENGHDLIFGHITQKAKFTKDKRETFFCDIDMIKNWLHSNGYAINNENNDFHKVIQSNKLEGGGSVLLAPNGKPSNLTPEQWHLVRTPEFKAWFGDWEALENAKMRDRGMDEVTLKQLAKNVSKVVDENGEPLILYRGNEGQMGKYGFEFKLGLNLLNKPKPQNFGFFFTDDLEVAKKYRKVDIYDSYVAGSIFTIFVNANKVLDITDFGHKIGQISFVEGLIEKGIKIYLFEDLFDKIINFFDEGGEYEGWGYNTFDYFDVFPELRDLFLANGYKGIIFKEISRTHFPYNVFVAFEPNQIKLADGSNTTFDGNNPDIRYEQGGGISKIYQIMQKYKYDLQPKWEVEKFQTGGRYFLTFADAQKFKKKLEALSHSFQYKVVSVEENPEPMPEKDEINPEQIRAEIEALGELLQVLEGEYRQTIQDEIEILKLALGELEQTKLLAPNGKPSNLTPEQWHLVRTPEFKAWFGDWENSPEKASKVVDENGEPLVVFREIKATEKNPFNTEFQNSAISVKWQTNLDEILKRKLPSETKVGDEVINFNKRGVVTEINNGIFKIKYEDGSVISGNAFGLTFYGEKKPKKVLSAFLNIRILGGIEKLMVHSFGTQKDSGILSISSDDKNYFTFRSNQVKLADGTNTTFDGSNPDIRFESGGEIDRSLARKKQDISFDDFHIETFANFKKVRQSDLPKKEPDFVSKSGSRYWYDGDKVYRMSNHWGRVIASCNWLLDGFAVRGLSQGYCKLNDFHREMSYLLNDKNFGKRFLVGKTSFLRSGKGAIDISENEGVFIKETSDFYVFDTFKVSKMTLAYVKPLQKVDNEIEGTYSSLRNFVDLNPNYSKKLVELYAIKESEVEDSLNGELGYDEEILIALAGNNYRVFYDEESDEFEITKKKKKVEGSAVIVLANNKNKNEIFRVINEEINTEFEPRFAVLYDSKIVGGSTFFIQDEVYFFDISISEKARGLGIAKELIDKIIEDAKKMGCNNLSAEVVNSKLLAYLRKIGFSIYKSQDQNYAELNLI